MISLSSCCCLTEIVSIPYNLMFVFVIYLFTIYTMPYQYDFSTIYGLSNKRP